MTNIGEAVSFTVPGGDANGTITYAWSWWDGSVTVTSEPTVTKVLNQGGTLPVVCQYCDEFGHSSTLTTRIVVNAPPIFTSPPTISVNDALLPFSTVLAGTAYDPEQAGALLFLWYNGSTPLGSGATIQVSTGTWANSFLALVASNETLSQLIVDVGNGTTRMDYTLQGYAASSLTVGGSSLGNSIIPSTNVLPEITLGPGQSVTFTAYAYDAEPGQLQFSWTAGTDQGWSQPYTSIVEPAPLANGAYVSQIVLSAGTAQTPGVKTAICAVTNELSGQSGTVVNTVRLDADPPPSILSISTDATSTNTYYMVPQNGAFHLTGTGTNAFSELLDYRWDFAVPAGVTLWGRTILLRPDQFPDFSNPAALPAPVLGRLTVTDRFGSSATVAIQSFVTVQVWQSQNPPVDQTQSAVIIT